MKKIISVIIGMVMMIGVAFGEPITALIKNAEKAEMDSKTNKTVNILACKIKNLYGNSTNN